MVSHISTGFDSATAGGEDNLAYHFSPGLALSLWHQTAANRGQLALCSCLCQCCLCARGGKGKDDRRGATRPDIMIRREQLHALIPQRRSTQSA